jgi:peptidoglycan hydrolase-like protein with peptidoglycan-binding domain
MFLTSKIEWAGIALTLLTTGMSLPAFPQNGGGSDSSKQGVQAFVIKNEIRKMQEILRDKGHYRGKVDGVFGLRTRASIRAYQKADNLPITGEIDTRTAAGLGVRPESNWANSQSAGRQDGHSSGSVIGESKREKPSAGIRRAKGTPLKTAQKEVSRATAMEDNRGSGASNHQAENEVHDQ